MRRVRLASLAALPVVSLLLAFAPAPAPGWKVIAWNDLGMHCMDSDYSVFSVLPPFNVVHAQLVDPSGKLILDGTGYTLTYEGVADPTGSINTTSVGKTNYWTYAPVLYGASGVPNTGLFGFDMPGPGNVPKSMKFDASVPEWIAQGVPIIPTDDAGHNRTYPMMKIVARNAAGSVLASATPVLPVSSEMDCRACHASGSGSAAEPGPGWVYDKQAERDYRLNILRLHDDFQLGLPAYDNALATLGMSPAGLYDTATTMQRPILCASCHASNALPGTGLPGIPQLTTSVHGWHGHVLDPTNGMTLDDSDNRSACYRCHPGSETRCLRGAMGAAVAPDGQLEMQCQDCHGNMSKVGNPARTGWLDQPNCQACHTGTALQNNGQLQYTNAFDASGQLRVAVNQTFATNPDVPAPGFSLYRFSSGHGGMRCEACHNSTHAEYPAAGPNDNLEVAALQGHDGVLAECTACHASQPVTTTGGPHGMHEIGQSWVENHHDLLGAGGVQQCRACHGTDYKGTLLSRAQGKRTFTTNWGSKTFFKGATISCYACHNGPNSESGTTNTPAVATSGTVTLSDQPVAITLPASDANGNPLTWRIVTQPAHGRVGLSANTATCIPDPGFAGTETFTWSAWDGKAESNLASVTETRLGNWSNYGAGYAGTGGVVPGFTAGAGPTLGQVLPITLDNTSGAGTVAVAFVSTEAASFDSKLGGTLLVEPTYLVLLPLPAGGLSAGTTLPSAPALLGVTIDTQAMQPDPGAHFGWAFSAGLRLTLGS